MSRMIGRRLLVLCPYPQGVAAGQRLKYEQYFDDWRACGLNVDVSPFMDMAVWRVAYEPGHHPIKLWGVFRGHLRRLRDLLHISRYDTVYVFMWVTPFGTTVLERLVSRLARRLVFDLEDNVLTGQNDLPKGYHPNPLVTFLKGPSKASYLVRTADHVITSSPALNDMCLAMRKDDSCTYISSSVDTDRFVPSNPYSNDRTVTIGWTGTFSSKIYLDLLRPVFVELARKVDFKLRVIGNFPYDLPGVELEVVTWTREREVEDLQAMDIGVYPLPVDDWVQGKSGLKAIQYMAFGLPTVATSVGTTPLIVRNRENGILVRTEEEWIDALEELVRDPALRRRLGEQARRDAVAKYSTKAIAGSYRRVLQAVIGEGH